MNKQKIYQVDAFTNEPFKGNPAGVMFVEKSTSAEMMQQIATEMNLSETAFIIPEDDSWPIRYFTPTNEVNLCGHATLSSAHIIYELRLKTVNETIQFKAKRDELSVRKEDDWIVMDFPAYQLTGINLKDGIAKAIGFHPIEIYESTYDWLVAVAASEEEIKNAVPNFNLIAELGLPDLLITAECSAKDIDFVLRCFAPGSGIPEDPVTGSAHCALTPLWTEKLGKRELQSFQLSKRTGTIRSKLNGNRVEIKGQALTVFEAELRV